MMDGKLHPDSSELGRRFVQVEGLQILYTVRRRTTMTCLWISVPSIAEVRSSVELSNNRSLKILFNCKLGYIVRVGGIGLFLVWICCVAMKNGADWGAYNSYVYHVYALHSITRISEAR